MHKGSNAALDVVFRVLCGPALHSCHQCQKLVGTQLSMLQEYLNVQP